MQFLKTIEQWLTIGCVILNWCFFLVFLFVSDNVNFRFSGVFFCIEDNAQTCLNMATTNLGVVLFALPYSFRHVFFRVSG